MNRQPHTTDTNLPGTPPSPEADSLDPISFDRRKRAEDIRQNEEAEREKRRRRQAARRKAERIRRAKIARLKTLIFLAVTALFILCMAIAGIVAAVKALTAPKEPALPDGAVTPEETALIASFQADTGLVYLPDNPSLAETVNAFLTDTTLGIPQGTAYVGEFGELARRYAAFGSTDGYFALKNAVRDVPMYANGYLWTESTSIRSSETDGYFYDTDTSFVSAVANICLWEGDGLFLSEQDADNQPKLDKSGGLTVLEKLEAVTDYLFRADTDRGVKYDPLSGLVYIHTADNDGTSTGNGSNRWFNFRFGYLDAYENISFQRAVTDLAKLYALLGESEKNDEYTAIAAKNRAAFNEKFWSEEKGRYVGCIDKNGTVHDYGFVFLNLEAIDAGFADAEKADRIFAWLDGTRTVEGDSVTGADIYSGSFVRNTTLAARDSWWDYQGGRVPLSENGSFGYYYQNGGFSLSTQFYDILARYKTGRTTQAAERLSALLDSYADGSFVGSDSRLRVAGDALAGLVPTAFLRTVYGFDTDGFRLCLTPDRAFLTALEETQKEAETAENDEKKNKKNEPDESALETLGIHNITFSRNRYGVLFESDLVYITAQEKKPVRLRIGGFESGASYDLITVENGFETAHTPLIADSEGHLDISADFGGGSYLKVVPMPPVTEE